MAGAGADPIWSEPESAPGPRNFRSRSHSKKWQLRNPTESVSYLKQVVAVPVSVLCLNREPGEPEAELLTEHADPLTGRRLILLLPPLLLHHRHFLSCQCHSFPIPCQHDTSGIQFLVVLTHLKKQTKKEKN